MKRRAVVIRKPLRPPRVVPDIQDVLRQHIDVTERARLALDRGDVKAAKQWLQWALKIEAIYAEVVTGETERGQNSTDR